MKALGYDISKINKDDLLFSNRALWKLIIPVMAEQLLNSFMGMIDTMMVSNVSPEAMAAVSLSDSINMLILQMFAALSTGGTIVCSHYIGQDDEKGANKAARQVFLMVLVSSLFLTLFGLIFRVPLLSIIFGQIEPEVMEASLIYFTITVLSYPFIALFSSGCAFFRASNNTKFPMRVSIESNIINVVLNAVFIFGLNWGVAGAALATLISRVYGMAVIHIALAKPKQVIVLNDYLKIRPDKKLLLRIISIGLPAGVENSMFQFGKLVIQSSVSTLGTVAIAAQSMTNIFETVNGMLPQGVGIALLTVAGQTIGSGRKEETKYYIAKMLGYAEIVIIISCIAVYFMANPVMALANMTEESKALAMEMLFWITIFKPLFWNLSFTLPNGMRACGDVRFPMTVSVCTMWGCRVLIAVLLIRVFGFGPMGVWIGMFCDWAIRAFIFSSRFLSGKFTEHFGKVL